MVQKSGSADELLGGQEAVVHRTQPGISSIARLSTLLRPIFPSGSAANAKPLAVPAYSTTVVQAKATRLHSRGHVLQHQAYLLHFAMEQIQEGKKLIGTEVFE